MDERLRALEAAAARGDVEAQAALLRERLRAGRLDPERLRLAAYLGHAAARGAEGGTSAVPGDLQGWVSGLAAWGPEPFRRGPDDRDPHTLDVVGLRRSGWRGQVLVRAALAVARLARARLPLGYPHQAQVAPEDVPRLAAGVDGALAAADVWLASPSHTAANAAHEAASAVPHAGLPGALAMLAARHCAPPYVILLIRDVRAALGCGLKEAKDLVDRPGGVAGVMAMVAARATADDAVRAAVRDALAPWALDG